MDPLSLVAIAVAVVVTAVALSRAAAARRELAEARARIATLEDELSTAKRALSPPKSEAPEEEEEPAEKEEAEEPEAPEEPSEGEARPVESGVDEAVVARADAMLREARSLARHIGFDHEIEVAGRKGVRVSVEVEDAVDESAIAHLRATSEWVLDDGHRDDERFLVIRR